MSTGSVFYNFITKYTNTFTAKMREATAKAFHNFFQQKILAYFRY